VELIATGNGGKCTDEIAELQGRRFGWFSELSGNEFLNEGRVKQLTGNGRLRGRRLFEGSFEFDAQCKFLIDTNYQPRIRGTDFGILRRVKPLPYGRTIPEAAVVPDWKGAVLSAEGDGLLSMILDAAHRYSARGLTPEPECVKRACEQFREENDHLGNFISECCESSERPDVPGDLKCGAHELYEHYRRWATEGGYTPLNIKNFAAKIADKGYEQDRSALGRLWRGLRLRPADAPSPAMDALSRKIESGRPGAEKTKNAAAG